MGNYIFHDLMLCPAIRSDVCILAPGPRAMAWSLPSKAEMQAAKRALYPSRRPGRATMANHLRQAARFGGRSGASQTPTGLLNENLKTARESAPYPSLRLFSEFVPLLRACAYSPSLRSAPKMASPEMASRSHLRRRIGDGADSEKAQTRRRRSPGDSRLGKGTVSEMTHT